MNVKELILDIREIAEQQEPIKSVFDGNVYDNWNSAEIKYGSFNVGLQSATYEGNQVTYTCVFYYGDRLLQDESNANEIYSDGMRAVQSVINILNQNDGINIVEPIVYEFFQQKFMDYLAGVYATVDITCDSEMGLCGIGDMDYGYPEIQD